MLEMLGLRWWSSRPSLFLLQEKKVLVGWLPGLGRWLQPFGLAVPRVAPSRGGEGVCGRHLLPPPCRRARDRGWLWPVEPEPLCASCLSLQRKSQEARGSPGAPSALPSGPPMGARRQGGQRPEDSATGVLPGQALGQVPHCTDGEYGLLPHRGVHAARMLPLPYLLERESTAGMGHGMGAATARHQPARWAEPRCPQASPGSQSSPWLCSGPRAGGAVPTEGCLTLRLCLSCAGARPASPPSLSPAGVPLTSIFTTREPTKLGLGWYRPCSQALQSVQVDSRNLTFESMS